MVARHCAKDLVVPSNTSLLHCLCVRPNATAKKNIGNSCVRSLALRLSAAVVDRQIENWQSDIVMMICPA